eukprot:TRINITY_DN46771_c0_g1_i1.p1 TRINITY_DN46771_c0_g1~~TRINITY_DN46771_c0_g1_i1.p1  ORF type:complete len:1531 (-),score=424.25 TRINITY_DN46771_c0_g1_i1:122-4561(-)
MQSCFNAMKEALLMGVKERLELQRQAQAATKARIIDMLWAEKGPKELRRSCFWMWHQNLLFARVVGDKEQQQDLVVEELERLIAAQDCLRQRAVEALWRQHGPKPTLLKTFRVWQQSTVYDAVRATFTQRAGSLLAFGETAAAGLRVCWEQWTRVVEKERAQHDASQLQRTFEQEMLALRQAKQQLKERAVAALWRLNGPKSLVQAVCSAWKGVVAYEASRSHARQMRSGFACSFGRVLCRVQSPCQMLTSVFRLWVSQSSASKMAKGADDERSRAEREMCALQEVRERTKARAVDALWRQRGPKQQLLSYFHGWRHAISLQRIGALPGEIRKVFTRRIGSLLLWTDTPAFTLASSFGHWLRHVMHSNALAEREATQDEADQKLRLLMLSHAQMRAKAVHALWHEKGFKRSLQLALHAWKQCVDGDRAGAVPKQLRKGFTERFSTALVWIRSPSTALKAVLDGWLRHALLQKANMGRESEQLLSKREIADLQRTRDYLRQRAVHALWLQKGAAPQQQLQAALQAWRSAVRDEQADALPKILRSGASERIGRLLEWAEGSSSVLRAFLGSWAMHALQSKARRAQELQQEEQERTLAGLRYASERLGQRAVDALWRERGPKQQLQGVLHIWRLQVAEQSASQRAAGVQKQLREGFSRRLGSVLVWIQTDASVLKSFFGLWVRISVLARALDGCAEVQELARQELSALRHAGTQMRDRVVTALWQQKGPRQTLQVVTQAWKEEVQAGRASDLPRQLRQGFSERLARVLLWVETPAAMLKSLLQLWTRQVLLSRTLEQCQQEQLHDTFRLHQMQRAAREKAAEALWRQKGPRWSLQLSLSSWWQAVLVAKAQPQLVPQDQRRALACRLDRMMLGGLGQHALLQSSLSLWLGAVQVSKSRRGLEQETVAERLQVRISQHHMQLRVAQMLSKRKGVQEPQQEAFGCWRQFAALSRIVQESWTAEEKMRSAADVDRRLKQKALELLCSSRGPRQLLQKTMAAWMQQAAVSVAMQTAGFAAQEAVKSDMAASLLELESAWRREQLQLGGRTKERILRILLRLLSYSDDALLCICVLVWKSHTDAATGAGRVFPDTGENQRKLRGAAAEVLLTKSKRAFLLAAFVSWCKAADASRSDYILERAALRIHEAQVVVRQKASALLWKKAGPGNTALAALAAWRRLAGYTRIEVLQAELTAKAATVACMDRSGATKQKAAEMLWRVLGLQKKLRLGFTAWRHAVIVVWVKALQEDQNEVVVQIEESLEAERARRQAVEAELAMLTKRLEEASRRQNSATVERSLDERQRAACVVLLRTYLNAWKLVQQQFIQEEEEAQQRLAVQRSDLFNEREERLARARARRLSDDAATAPLQPGSMLAARHAEYSALSSRSGHAADSKAEELMLSSDDELGLAGLPSQSQSSPPSAFAARRATPNFAGSSRLTPAAAAAAAMPAAMTAGAAARRLSVLSVGSVASVMSIPDSDGDYIDAR